MKSGELLLEVVDLGFEVGYFGACCTCCTYSRKTCRRGKGVDGADWWKVAVGD